MFGDQSNNLRTIEVLHENIPITNVITKFVEIFTNNVPSFGSQNQRLKSSCHGAFV
jgi:hypothetical protein